MASSSSWISQRTSSGNRPACMTQAKQVEPSSSSILTVGADHLSDLGQQRNPVVLALPGVLVQRGLQALRVCVIQKFLLGELPAKVHGLSSLGMLASFHDHLKF